MRKASSKNPPASAGAQDKFGAKARSGIQDQARSRKVGWRKPASRFARRRASLGGAKPARAAQTSSETQNRRGEVQGQIEAAQIKFEIQTKAGARRLTKIFALLAVLALLAAGSLPWPGGNARSPARALAKAAAEAAGKFDLAPGGWIRNRSGRCCRKLAARSRMKIGGAALINWPPGFPGGNSRSAEGGRGHCE